MGCPQNSKHVDFGHYQSTIKFVLIELLVVLTMLERAFIYAADVPPVAELATFVIDGRFSI